MNAKGSWGQGVCARHGSLHAALLDLDLTGPVSVVSVERPEVR